MSYDSGNRFGGSNSTSGSNYYAPPSFPNNSTAQASYTPPPMQTTSFETSQTGNQLGSATQEYQSQPLPLSAQLAPFNVSSPPQYQNELLLMHIKPTERAKFKEENLKKHNMRYDSVVYQYMPKHLQSLMVQHPEDFPGGLAEKLKEPLKKYRKDERFFHRMVLGGVLYWALLRSRPWFKLTGTPLMRFSFVVFNFANWMDATFLTDTFLAKNICENNENFQNVLKKYEVPQITRGRVKLLTD